MFFKPKKQPSLRSGASRCWHINVKEAIMSNTQDPNPKTKISSRKHKGGRPSIPDDQKRTCCKKVYFTKEDCDCIEHAADANRMSDSEYIARMSLNGKVVAPISPDFARDFRAVANLSNNMNQLAHQANKEGYHTVARDILALLPNLRTVLNQIYVCL